MAFHCAPCGKDFEKRRDLDKHLNISIAHRYPKLAQKKSQLPDRGNQMQLSIRQKNHKILDRPNPNEVGSHPSTITKGKNQQPISSSASSGVTAKLPASTIEVVQIQEPQWTVIPEEEYESTLETLALHTHSLEVLEANNFLVRPYVDEDPADKSRSLKKCTRCSTSERKFQEGICKFHLCKRNPHYPTKPYRCCFDIASKGCRTATEHDFRLPPHVLRYDDFRATPASNGRPKASAVVLDCEMAGVIGNTSGEPILVCAIDYVSGATILNHYVFPTQRIIQMRTTCHGVTKNMLQNAHDQGITLAGWEGARTELWKHIDENTTLVGHALENDLSALRMIHRRVVDSSIMARSAIGKGGRHSLEVLCMQLPHVEIRQNKGGIHDCMEDVLATREVVLFCTRKTDEFQAWVLIQQAEQTRLEKERVKLRLEKEEKKAREQLKLEEELAAKNKQPI